jgi:hypothetical protein
MAQGAERVFDDAKELNDAGTHYASL